MNRLRAFLLVPALSLSNGLAFSALHAADEKSPPPIQSEALVSPAGPGAVGASLARAPDGTLWLSWVQPGRSEANALCFSTLDAATRKWTAPRTIVADLSITTSAMDFPQLAVGPGGSATVIWTDGHGGARVSQSVDRGTTWSPPGPWTRDGNGVEKFSLTALADGRVLVAWLDGRTMKAGGKMPQLYTRILTMPTLSPAKARPTEPDMLVDPAVCDCCQTTLTAFPDGGALLAYRGRTESEVRDIRTARFDGRKWAEPRPLNNDDWRINACPVNGPRLDNDRGRVTAAWFTAADNDPRVLASYSPDAGGRFLLPLRIDRGQPTGHVDTVILRDGAMLVTWVEQNGSLWLRRISPDFAPDEANELAPASAGRVSGYPRIALVRDYAGGRTSAQGVVVYAREDKPATLHTLLVTVPEGDLLSATKDCDCAPTAEQLLGLPLRGTTLAVLTGPSTLRVGHDEMPGVFAAGAHEFHAAPDVLATMQPGRQFLGRIELRNGAWWVFDVRLLATPAPTSEEKK